jgi:hypothetical protein
MRGLLVWNVVYISVHGVKEEVSGMLALRASVAKERKRNARTSYSFENKRTT